MPKIENCSRADIKNGTHGKVTPNTILIQISDVGYEQPKPLMYFRRSFQFWFDDVNENETNFLNDTSSIVIAKLLRSAYKNDYDIIVHCHAGLCRSGAVVEAALHIGFNPVVSRIRYPNSDITVKLLKTLETIRE